MAKYNLKISVIADEDLDRIYEYGFYQWGEAQADDYYDALIEHFALLCQNPFLYAPIDDIRAGYRRSVCGIHSVYYRVNEKTVEIMTVIGAQDMNEIFNKMDD